MRNKTLTQANRREWDKLNKVEEAARNAVYATASDNRTPFNACYAGAPQPVKVAFCNARDAVQEFEFRMVQEGRGYRGDTGVFRPY